MGEEQVGLRHFSPPYTEGPPQPLLQHPDSQAWGGSGEREALPSQPSAPHPLRFSGTWRVGGMQRRSVLDPRQASRKGLHVSRRLEGWWRQGMSSVGLACLGIGEETQWFGGTEECGLDEAGSRLQSVRALTGAGASRGVTPPTSPQPTLLPVLSLCPITASRPGASLLRSTCGGLEPRQARHTCAQGDCNSLLENSFLSNPSSCPLPARARSELCAARHIIPLPINSSQPLGLVLRQGSQTRPLSQRLQRPPADTLLLERQRVIWFFTLEGWANGASCIVCAHFPTEMPGVCHPGAASAMLAPQASARHLGSPGQGLASVFLALVPSPSLHQSGSSGPEVGRSKSSWGLARPRGNLRK